MRRVLAFIPMLGVAFASYCGSLLLFSDLATIRRTCVPFLIVTTVSLLLGMRIQKWLRDRARAGYARCGHCGYNLTGHRDRLQLDSSVCPECGQAFRQVGVVEEGQIHARQFAHQQGRLLLAGALIATLSITLSGMTLILTGGLELGEGFCLLLLAVAAIGFCFVLAYAKSRKVTK